MSRMREDKLDCPTRCSDRTVAHLLAPVHQFPTVFALNARKEQARPAEDLVDGWREAIAGQLDDLAHERPPSPTHEIRRRSMTTATDEVGIEVGGSHWAGNQADAAGEAAEEGGRRTRRYPRRTWTAGHR